MAKVPQDIINKVKEVRFNQWMGMFENIFKQSLANPTSALELKITIDPLIPTKNAQAENHSEKNLQGHPKGSRVSNSKKSR